MMMQPPKVVVDRSFRRGLSTFNDDRLRWLDEAASIGPLVGLEFGRTTAWVLTDVELARRVLITEAASFVRPLNFTRPTRMAIGTISSHSHRNSMGKSDRYCRGNSMVRRSWGEPTKRDR